MQKYAQYLIRELVNMLRKDGSKLMWEILQNQNKMIRYLDKNENQLNDSIYLLNLIFYFEQILPADLVVLATSEPDGIAYVSTATLDGERTLKNKQAINDIQQIYIEHGEIELAKKAKITIECQAPDKNIYHFSGKMTVQNKESQILLDSQSNKNEAIYISTRQMLLRGSILQNTKQIIGCVIYTGRQTKIMMNAGGYKFKQSRVDKIANVALFCQVILIIILVIFMGLMNYAFAKSHSESEYLFYGIDNFEIFSLKAALSYSLLFNQLIPIALIIQIEIVKIFQTVWIEFDHKMHSTDQDMKIKCLNFQLHEDLGSVKHVFSDKTGTLTCNKLTARSIQIGQKEYSGSTEIKLGKIIQTIVRNQISQVKDRDFNKIKLSDILTISSEFMLSQLFFLNISLCNDLIVVKNPQTGKQEYQGYSTDEMTLLNLAALSGFQMTKRLNDTIYLTMIDPKSKHGKSDKEIIFKNC